MNFNTSFKLSDKQYFKEVHPKKIIVLHHTVSGPGVTGDVNWWEKTPEKVGTPFIIDRDGEVFQVFDEKYWIHHLGITSNQLRQFQSSTTNIRLNQLSIGIELDSWGGLVEKGGKFFTSTGKEIPAENVITYDKPYRGYKHYEKYTKFQIIALRKLITFLCEKYGIKPYYFEEMFEFNRKAINGYHGIWSHTSYRPDKNDIHPQPDLIEMLKSLS